MTSGGQCRKGACTKRTGSTRQDDGQVAALQLIVAARTLKFAANQGLPVFKRFVTEAARADDRAAELPAFGSDDGDVEEDN